MHATSTFISLLGLGLAAGGHAAGGYGPFSGASEEAATALHAQEGPAARSSSPCTAPLPSAALAVPPGNECTLQLNAVGVQIYTCTEAASGPDWIFTAPEANLHDRQGELVGTHYAGPTWVAKDGSKVVAAKIEGVTPDPASIPWLLLRAVSHAGRGRMEKVTFIQRLQTGGGTTPSSGCDATHVGAVARVPYTATYRFYEAK